MKTYSPPKAVLVFLSCKDILTASEELIAGDWPDELKGSFRDFISTN